MPGRLEADPIPRANFDPSGRSSGSSRLHGNKACASGIKSIALGFQEIATGNLDCVLAGGTESMSRLPYYLEGARWDMSRQQELVDGMYRDGFFCPLAKMLMGETAETLAVQYKITGRARSVCVVSQQTRSDGAIQRSLRCGNRSRQDRSKKGTTVFSRDEHLFSTQRRRRWAKYRRMVFQNRHDYCGNSSGITGWRGGGSAGEREIPPAKQSEAAGANSGRDFRGRGPAPQWASAVPAIRKLEQKTRPQGSTISLWFELNEAFRPVLACDRELHFDRRELNVNGGAIALGHPIGCNRKRDHRDAASRMLNARRGAASQPSASAAAWACAGHRECFVKEWRLAGRSLR